MIIRGKCSQCGKVKWFLFKQKLTLVGVGEVYSEHKICSSCRSFNKKVTIESNKRYEGPVALKTDEKDISN